MFQSIFALFTPPSLSSALFNAGNKCYIYIFLALTIFAIVAYYSIGSMLIFDFDSSGCISCRFNKGRIESLVFFYIVLKEEKLILEVSIDLSIETRIFIITVWFSCIIRLWITWISSFSFPLPGMEECELIFEGSILIKVC